jgi:predicted MFS family arabinose efflux permease
MDRIKLRDTPLLRRRDGRLFLAAQALDSLAAGVATVALPWLVLDRTHSTAAAGLVFTLEIAPYVVFGLPAGLAGDRLPRRPLIATAHLVQAVCAVIIPAWALFGVPPIAVIALAAFAIGSARAFSDAGAFGAVAALVGRDQFTTGQAVLSAAWAVGLLAGPPLGGALIGILGPAPTLWAQAAAFAGAATLIMLVRQSLGRPEPSAADQGAAQGLRFLFDDPLLRMLTTVGVLWNLVSAGATALLVPLLRVSVGLSPRQAGVVLACASVMGIVAAPVVHRLESRSPGYRLYLAAVLVSGPVTALVGASVGVVGSVVCVGAWSLVNWVVMAIFIGERQRRAPHNLQARVGISGRMVMTASMAVGAALASTLTALMPLRDLYVAMGFATLLVAAFAMMVLPRAAATLSLAAGD